MIGDELGGDGREQDLTVVGLTAKPHCEVQRRTVVVSPAAIRRARVEREARPDLQPSRPLLVAHRTDRGDHRRDRSESRLEHGDGRVALSYRLDQAATVMGHAVGDQLIVAHERHRHRGGAALPLRGGARDVRYAEGDDPGGERLGPAGPQPLDQFAGRGRTARRVSREPEADRRLELLGLHPADSFPGRQHPARRRPREQRKRRRRQAVDVAGLGRVGVGGQLGRPVPERACAPVSLAGFEESPKSTSFTRPPVVRIRLEANVYPLTT